LITAVLQEIHEGWIVGRKYINFENNKDEENLELPIYRKMLHNLKISRIRKKQHTGSIQGYFAV